MSLGRMSDLIDLNSPGVKGLINSKLSSPLIPVPKNTETNEQPCSSVTEKREGLLGSNPFDSVLHETAEYVRKKGDPFELMLQRALKCKSNKNTEPKAQSVTFKDDFTPKRKKRFLKMNKTLDESLIEDKLSSISEEKEETVSLVAGNTDVCDSNQAKEKDSLFKEFVLPTSSTFKPRFDLRRSLSQGDGRSPRTFQCLDRRSQSITNTPEIALQSDSSVLSVLNKGFLESEQSQQSMFSDLSDVSSITRFNSASTTSVLSLKEETNQSNSMKGEDSKQTMDDKLIDVSVFIQEPSFNREHNNSTSSISSLDSVFIDNSKVDNLILNEAKALSRIFEELTIRTDSVSNTDDLLSNDNLWISELLPAFEDETEDDLIKLLLISPEKNVKDDKNHDLKQSPASIDDAERTFMKEVELQFTNCISTEKQTMITTLLLNLKKLVKAENNPEANKLIDGLGSVLGVECKNNTELLASLHISNELRTSEMSDDKLDGTAQSDKTRVDKSRGENRKVSCKKKICDNESSLPHHTLENTSQAMTISNDNSSARTSPCNNNEDPHDTSVSSSSTKDKDSHPDKQLAIELLVNLRKLLSGQAEDATILQLFKRIGKALNFASNNSETEDDSQTDAPRIMHLETSEPEHNSHAFSATKAAVKLSFNSKFKVNSVSAIHSSNAQVNARCKNTSGLKDLKRFSSNPELINTTTNKGISFSRASNTRTAKTAELDSKNKKLSTIIDVRNKFEKNSDVISKRGPMKAMHPINTMQKNISLGKRAASSSQIITPLKFTTASFGGKIISSAPNSMVSSTPDNQKGGTWKTQLTSTNKKRNLSCDISPVSIQKEGSPRRSIQPLSSKICTPTRQRMDSSGIPKFCTPPRQLSSSFDMSHRQRSPQYLNRSLTNYQRYSPVRPRSAEKRQQSPLHESKKFLTKVKPLKLISKLKENTTSDFTEKENKTMWK